MPDDKPGWIGVDLDCTLAYYEPGYGAKGIIGSPLPPMVARVKRWLAEGREVRILTARCSHPLWCAAARDQLEEWCERHLGQVLRITCTKDYEMDELWDDRARQVVANKGSPVWEVI